MRDRLFEFTVRHVPRVVITVLLRGNLGEVRGEAQPDFSFVIATAVIFISEPVFAANFFGTVLVGQLPSKHVVRRGFQRVSLTLLSIFRSMVRSG